MKLFSFMLPFCYSCGLVAAVVTIDTMHTPIVSIVTTTATKVFCLSHYTGHLKKLKLKSTRIVFSIKLNFDNIEILNK